MSDLEPSDPTGAEAPAASFEVASRPKSTPGVADLQPEADPSAHGPAPHDLKGKTARGVLASAFGQGAAFFLRTGSMMIFARLLAPEDFGLVSMVTACTGFLALFRDAGLSMATVQRASISRAQTSMLFWINLAVGALLTAVCAAVAPLVAAFYREPRLLWVTVVVGTGFLFNGATAQHRAVLQRNMRFGILAVVDISALLLSILLGLGMAVAGQGYWALVGMAVALPVASFVGLWLAGGWLPALPRRGAGVGSMLKYGGTVTLNNVVVYLAYNADKVLLGRFWGSVPLGLYGRAYQLINLPNDTLASSVGLVAFPALARLQNDPARLRSYFLNGYGLFLSLIIPITTACALFAEDIIRVFLGQKWGEAAPVFRLLVPTILAFALINPFSWLLQATGRVVRSLNIAFLIAPLVILGYVAGLSHGPTGVAAGFSTTIMLLVVPVIFWATRGTPVTALDALKVVMRPFLAALIGAGVTLGAWGFIGALTTPLLRLVVANAALFGVYALVLCFGMGQWSLYLRLFRELGLWPFARRSTRDASMQPQNA